MHTTQKRNRTAFGMCGLIATIFFIAAPEVGAQQTPLDRLDFFLGEWDLRTEDVQRDGTYAEGRAHSTAYRILDGTAMQDDYRHLNDRGEVIFRGTSIRSYNRSTGTYQVVWLMPGEVGITELQGRFDGEDFVLSGTGYDAMGRFLEEARYFDISADSYSFTMKRSYDGGESWLDPFGTIEASRVKKP